MLKKNKKRIWIASIVLFASLCTGISLAYASTPEAAPSGQSLPQPVTTKTDETQASSFSVLLCGTDGSSVRTDTMLYIYLDAEQKKINLTSLPRDTKVEVDGRTIKLNACTVRGGKELLFQTVEAMTNAPVNHYVFVDFSGFRDIIDLLGGVEVNVEKDMQYSDSDQGLSIDLKKGVQVLDGKQAEEYVRYRRYLEGDIARTRVQQQFIKSLIEQKNKPQYWFKLPELFALLSRYSETNLALADLLSLVPFAGGLKEEDIQIFQLPGAPDDSKISYFIYDEEEGRQLFAEHFGGQG